MINNFDDFSEFVAFMKKVYNGDLNYSLLDIYETFIHNQTYDNLMKKYCILYDMELKYDTDDEGAYETMDFMSDVHVLFRRELDFITHNPDFNSPAKLKDKLNIGERTAQKLVIHGFSNPLHIAWMTVDDLIEEVGLEDYEAKYVSASARKVEGIDLKVA